MASERCPRCNKMRPNVGPWNGHGGGWKRLCGICKCNITLATPGIRERLARDVRRAGEAVGERIELTIEVPKDEGSN